MADVQSHAKETHDQFADQMDITIEEIEERLDTLVNEYQALIEEARRSVTSSYYDEADADPESVGDANEQREIGSINTAEEWIDITVKVVEL
jgi:replication factor A1